MVWLTGLPGILARTGYPVVEVAGWRTRGYKGRQLTAVRGIVPHHTATPWSRQGDYPSLAIVRDGRAGLPGPLAQLGLGRSGTWYVIAAGWANHAGTVKPALESTHANRYAIGIEAEAAGTGDPRDWPARQMDSYARGCRVLADAFGLPLGRVLAHKEICYPAGRKSDPSFNMDAFRRSVAAVGAKPSTPTNGKDQDVVTNEDRAAIAAEAARAVVNALGPRITAAEDAAERARTEAAQVRAELEQHDAAVAKRDAAAERTGNDRWARRDRMNTREYGKPGVKTYAELARGGPSYDELSGGIIRGFPVASAV